MCKKDVGSALQVSYRFTDLPQTQGEIKDHMLYVCQRSKVRIANRDKEALLDVNIRSFSIKWLYMFVPVVFLDLQGFL